MKLAEHRGLEHRATVLASRHPSLCPYVEILRSDGDERHHRAHDIVLRVIEFNHLVRHDADDRFWPFLFDYLAREGGRTDVHRDAAYAAAVGLLTCTHERDYEHLEALVDLVGVPAASRYFDEIDEHIGDPQLPATTALVRRLCSPEDYQVFTHPADDPPRTQRLRHTGQAVAAALLLDGIDHESTDVADPILTVRGFEHIVKHCDAREWRMHLAPIAADPWGEHAYHLWKLTKQLDLPGPAAIIALGLQRFRERAEVAERRWVAEQVKDIIASSGLSQRDFATRVGTSPSRISTYVNGHVTPSASMMRRMSQVSLSLSPRLGADATANGRAASLDWGRPA